MDFVSKCKFLFQLNGYTYNSPAFSKQFHDRIVTVEVFDVTPRTLEGLPSGLPAEIMCHYESVTTSGIRERAMFRRHSTLGEFERWFASFHVGSYEWIRTVVRESEPSEDNHNDGPSDDEPNDGGDGPSDGENGPSDDEPSDGEDGPNDGGDGPSEGGLGENNLSEGEGSQDEEMEDFSSEDGIDYELVAIEHLGQKRAGGELSTDAPTKRMFLGTSGNEPKTPPTPCYADFHSPDFSPRLGKRKAD